MKSALWEAANILRGSAVDPTDWKGYILQLLFFKRISDVRDEEHVRLQEECGGNVYRCNELDMVGWLCPALLQYFDEAPKQIFAEVRPRADHS